ncbi:hypothetical protein J3R30DRAFT_3464884 [Lentinula aciculospora]|uniref:Uncharacterized protein n=1 Tax=Lentinula aciculospora TaxID=153920 RepID=A0A9W9AFZ9_9AGAR|nr:hypothetical protein J3R30DRAFT_3464884 [Lentinula aciculospora]
MPAGLAIHIMKVPTTKSPAVAVIVTTQADSQRILTETDNNDNNTIISHKYKFDSLQTLQTRRVSLGVRSRLRLRTNLPLPFCFLLLVLLLSFIDIVPLTAAVPLSIPTNSPSPIVEPNDRTPTSTSPIPTATSTTATSTQGVVPKEIRGEVTFSPSKTSSGRASYQPFAQDAVRKILLYALELASGVDSDHRGIGTSLRVVSAVGSSVGAGNYINSNSKSNLPKLTIQSWGPTLATPSKFSFQIKLKNWPGRSGRERLWGLKTSKFSGTIELVPRNSKVGVPKQSLYEIVSGVLNDDSSKEKLVMIVNDKVVPEGMENVPSLPPLNLPGPSLNIPDISNMGANRSSSSSQLRGSKYSLFPTSRKRAIKSNGGGKGTDGEDTKTA